MVHWPLNEGDTILRNVWTHLPRDTASHPRRPKSCIKKFGKGKVKFTLCLSLSHTEEWRYSSTHSELNSGQ